MLTKLYTDQDPSEDRIRTMLGLARPLMRVTPDGRDVRQCLAVYNSIRGSRSDVPCALLPPSHKHSWSV